MPFSGSEVLEVSIASPIAGAVVGDWIVSIDQGRTTPSGVLPLTGAFTIMDSLTGAAKAYTGLPNVVHPYAHNVCSHGGYAWAVISSGLWRITPSTGNVDYMGAIGSAARACVGLSGKIYCFAISSAARIYDISAASWSTGVDVLAGSQPVAAVAAFGRIIVSYTAGPWQVIDAAGDVLASGNTANTAGGGVSVGKWAYLPRNERSVIDVFDLDALSPPTTLSLGTYVCGTNIAIGGDGWLYTYDYVVSGGRIVAVSPLTGVVDHAAPPSSRARRFSIFAAGGNVAIPAGAPL